MTGLLELADRCEKADGPDRRIDAAICRLVDLPKCQYPDCLPDVLARIIERVESDSNQDYDVRHYTSSIEAAMMLVPEGMGWMTRWPFDGPPTNAYVSGRDTDHVNGKAATPALALCAAALRARAATPAQPGKGE